MTVTLMQTADAIFYYPMLIETAKTVRALCARNGFAYEQYVGIKRGHMPWQASYNRVFMLKEMIDRGYDGWVFYLDADAFIHDLSFDLTRYLEERSSAAAIFAGYSTSEIAYDINSGGFALNLAHPVAKGIVHDWYRIVDDISVENFDPAIHWEHDLANDQHLLFGVLQRYVEEFGTSNSIIFERANQSYVNNGPFVAQLLRSMFPDYQSRFAAVQARVAEIMADAAAFAQDEGAGVYIRAAHPRLVTSCGRKTLEGVRSTGAAGGLLFGPYMRLAAGRHKARIIGELRLRAGQSSSGFHHDVAIDHGHVVLAGKTVHFDRPTRGIISELPFSLATETHSLEIRVIVDQDVDMSIHAVQIVNG